MTFTHSVFSQNELDERLRACGLRPSMARLQVLQVLLESPVRHLDAEGVYQRLYASAQPLGMTTVYKLLAQFEQVGLVQRRELQPGKRVYELAWGNQQEHGHLVCLKSRQVFEFDTGPLSAALIEIAARHGLMLSRVEITAYGVPAPEDTSQA